MIRPLALALAALASPALADTARTSARLPVFDRPSSDAALLGKVEANARVEVIQCTGAREWCLVGDPGSGETLGWVKAGYLIGVGAVEKASPFRYLVNPSFADLGVTPPSP